MYEDTGGDIFAALIMLALSIFFFLLCGRFVGWLLGISKISTNQQTIIEQNERLIDLLDTNLRLQRAIAKKQFGQFESELDEDEE